MLRAKVRCPSVPGSGVDTQVSAASCTPGICVLVVVDLMTVHAHICQCKQTILHESCMVWYGMAW